jgi:hypothetical protein
MESIYFFNRWGGTCYSYMLVNPEKIEHHIYNSFKIYEKSIIKREQSNTSKG